MNPVPITSLEEAITTFREWLSHYSPNTVRPYEYLFGKLLEVQAEVQNYGICKKVCRLPLNEV